MKCNNILEAMCNTPLIRLNRIGKDSAAEIYIKADYMNPGGSVKDRIGLSMIDEAERSDDLGRARQQGNNARRIRHCITTT